MGASRKKRPARDEYFLNIAQQVALRSTCLRRNYGAVIVKDDQIVSTGFAGAPRGTPHCLDIGFCYRGQLGARPGEHYEYCRAVHAEQNAIAQASKSDMMGATLYLVGLDAKTKEHLSTTVPCLICRRQIINAQIRMVVARQSPKKIQRYPVERWIRNRLGELAKVGGRLVPVEPQYILSESHDQDREERLTSRFSLDRAIVVTVWNYQEAKHAVARVAARYFVSSVKSRCSVALSCGDTILSMLESLPRRPELKLAINQLSIEGDPAMIHQAPATLVGLLRSKCSPRSVVCGLHLPPMKLMGSLGRRRQDILDRKVIAGLRRKALAANYVFLGLGSARPGSASFWAMAQAATGGRFAKCVKKYGIVGEINNQVFNERGEDCSENIPRFGEHVVNILGLADFRRMAKEPARHKVVMVATGRTKREGMRVALETGLANVLITSREDADYLLGC